MESERRDVALSQWFTPPDTASRIVRWAYLPDAYKIDCVGGFTVLEPSAGQGALVKPWSDYKVTVTAVEIDPRNCEVLKTSFARELYCADFLTLSALGPFDLAVLNPPFENGAAEAHVLHALKFAPRVVAHVPLTTLEGKKRREGLWSEAYLKRLAICSSRPKYGEKAGATAMCTIDVVRRPEGQPKNGRVAACGVDVEWWI
jgi:predicted RNA methylase